MTPGGSIIFRPINTDLDVRCEATWAKADGELRVRLYAPRKNASGTVRRNVLVWQHTGAVNMQTVEYVQWVFADVFGMSPADIERVNWRTERNLHD